MSAHAFLAPSSAPVWGPNGCAAFPRMAAAYPDDDGDLEAREGTAAHHYVTESIAGRPAAVGTTAPNAFVMTEEMAKAGALMIADARAVMATQGVQAWTEMRMHIPVIHPSLNWGTTDFCAVDRNTRTIFVWDYKYGHRHVDPYENWQLVDYAAGAVTLFSLTLDAIDDWAFDLRIYGPRMFNPYQPRRQWLTTGAGLKPRFAELRAAAAEAGMPDAPTKTGPYCLDCPARHACPALRAVAGSALDVSMRSVPLELSAVEVATELTVIKAAQQRLSALESGLEARAEAMINAGKTVPGWSMQSDSNQEKWQLPAAEIISHFSLMGHDVRKPEDVMTPNQAREKGIDEAVILNYAKRMPGKKKLKPVADDAARKVFE